ncbi:MAG TPA: Xaa-Pro peptidase family protein [Syntrophales bacterium]|nr:Xaa-Pro peptidase family protein [Syntrophales bacterium]
MPERNEKAKGPFPGRVERVRKSLPGWSAAGALFFGRPSIRYLTGFTGSEGTLFVGAEGAALLVDGRYTTQAAEETSGIDVITCRDRQEGLVGFIGDRDLADLVFESAALACDAYFGLRDALGGRVRLNPLGRELGGLRKIKEAQEIEKIRRAAEIASGALLAVLETLGPGEREIDVARRLEREMESRGSEGPSFETIVVSGPKTALPHGRPGPVPMAAGGFVVIDFGAVVEGYASDETCTVALGAPSPEQAKVYGVVKEAHDRAMELVREGTPCRAVDEAAREWIDRAGFGAFFTHGTGHGVGLEVHEPPRISTRDDGVLEEGMVVTVEPGVYIPGKFGVRIEDLVVVKKGGCEILSSVPKGLKILS